MAYKTARDLPTEYDEEFRQEIENDAAKTLGDSDRYQVRLLTLDWIDGADARRAVRYLDTTAWLFEVLDWQERKIRLVLTDESLDLTEDYARATFETPAEVENWFDGLGYDIRIEGWDK